MTAEFFIEVNAGGLPWFTQHTQALSEHVGVLSYWTLSIAAYDNHSDALIHVYYNGEGPSDEVRDRVNGAIRWFFGLRWDQSAKP